MSSYSTGRSSALRGVLRIAADKQGKYEATLKAAEDRADRKERESGQRPDPHNSSNVQAARQVRGVAEECLREILMELRSARYEESGFQTIYGHAEEIRALVEAYRDWQITRGDARPAAEAKYEAALEECIRDEWAEQRVVELRRDAVMRGEAEPLPEDAEWLEAQAEKQAALAKEASNLAASLRKKVPSGK